MPGVRRGSPASSSSLKWSESDGVTPGHVAVDCTWMLCNIVEQEHPLVVFHTPGTEAGASCHGAGGRKCPGRVTFIYQTLNAQSRRPFSENQFAASKKKKKEKHNWCHITLMIVAPR